jgi:hypothetical protein
MKWIYDYDPLPAFTATFSGFLGSDDVSCVTSLTFSVSPAYTGAAGTYQIIPAATSANYVFTPVSGPLYVNPNGPGTKQIKPRLVCVEQLSTPGPDGFLYLANYEYENNNPTDVFIPIGPDNYFSGQAAYNGANQPQLFLAGGGTFTVPFDGQKLIWTVISFKNNGQKGAVASQASSSSSRCNKSAEAEAPIIAGDESADIKIYPNPATGKLFVELPEGVRAINEISVHDIYGKTFQVATSSLESQPVELDLSGLRAGMYLIKIRTDKATETVRFIKK